MNYFKELAIPFVALLLFFAVQSVGVMSEFNLTVFIILTSLLTFFLQYNKKEFLLYTIGIFLGLLIEVGLRYFGYQQVWTNASLFGVPYWLPLIWGFGFVIITRLGIFIRN